MSKKSAKQVANFLGTSALTRPLFALGAASVLLGAGPAQAIDANTLPQNPNVVGGKDSFSQTGNTLNIKQHTNRTVIDWRSFDIGSQAQVNFNQPGTNSISVNRVNSSANASDIEGGLHANGQVWVLNPNGVFFGKNARVDAAGIVATTANINDKAFMAGGNKLHMTGADHGSVVNRGNITVGQSGLAAFVAPSVRNSGTINATVGRVTLAAGSTYTLDLAGDHLVELGLGSVKAVVDNSGKIVNPGGTIALTAKAAGQVVNSVVNVSGLVSASSVSKSGGTITLGADDINTTSTARIVANAAHEGTGGSISAVANKQGNYDGAFSANGGRRDGAGGQIETSGHDVSFGGNLHVKASATHGRAGMWKVDPTDLTIDATQAGNIEASLHNGTGVDLSTAGDGNNGDITLSASINATTATNGADLILEGRHLSATGGSTINISGEPGSALVLDVNTVNTLADTTSQSTNWISDALGMAGNVAGGTTIHLGAASYSGGVQIHSSDITLNGEPGAKILSLTNGMDAVEVFGNNVTIENLEFAGPADQSYKTFAWGGTVTRGIFVESGAQNFLITGNNIHGLRNDILVDGRNTGSITGNTIDNSKSGISVQYTDGTAYDKSLDNTGATVINITGNVQGQYGNEWGINYHLNGYWNGVPGDELHPSPNPVLSHTYLASAPTAAWQQGMLTQSAANGGMSILDQAYQYSNRTSVTVTATGGNDAAQGSALTALATIQAGVNDVVAGGTVNILNGTYVINAANGYTNGYLGISKSVKLIGQSEAGVILDARGASSYGLRIIGGTDGVTLEDFTLYGVTASGGYGVKAEDTTNLDIDHVTSKGAYKAQFDLNGVRTGEVNAVTADGNGVSGGAGSTKGAAIAITDSQNVKVENSSIIGGSYGGIGIYQSNKLSSGGYSYQAKNITIADTNTYDPNGVTNYNYVYTEDESATNNFGVLNVQGFSSVAGLDANPVDTFKYFQNSKVSAENYLDSLGAAGLGYVEGWTGTAADNNFSVDTVNGHAMSIQAAVTAAAPNATITVGAGTYTGDVTINKSGLTLISASGAAATTIQGVAGTSAEGAIFLTPGSDDTTIGNIGHGFTILGFDSANPAGENAAVYIQGGNSGSSFAGNHITANGDEAFLTEYNAAVTNLTIDHNTIDGQTFNGANAASGDQFSVPNVSRGLVYISGGSGVTNTKNITFTNNLVSGTTGGANGNSNYLVTIDAVGAEIEGNTFKGTVTGTSAQLRTRGTATTISGNTFDDNHLGTTANAVEILNQSFTGADAADNTFAEVLADNTFNNRSVWVDHSIGGSWYVSAGINGLASVATSGDTLHVGAGTYEEQVIVNNKNLTIEGAGIGQTIIEAPDLLSHSVTPYATAHKAIVSVENGANLTISDLTIDGLGKGNANYAFDGIGFFNASGTVDNVDITGIRDGGVGGTISGNQDGVGVIGYNTDGTARSITLQNSTIEDFQKTAAAFDGGNLTVDVEGNIITGAGSTGVTAQNGIQFYGVSGTGNGIVTGTISGNTISGVSYQPASNYSSTAVLLLDASGTTVSGNTITGAGTSDYSNGISVSGSTGVSITGNTIKDFGWGVWVGDTYGTSSATVTNNVIADNGVGLGLGDEGTDASTLIAHSNSITGNTAAVELDSGSATNDFTGNWWGTTNDATILSGVTGTNASDVNFSSFLASGTDTAAATGFQGDFSHLIVTTLGGGSNRIGEAISEVDAGGTVSLLDGTYTLSGELDIAKSVSLVGQSRAGTIITSNSTGYGIYVTGDDVSLSKFTYNAPTAVGATYGIKVEPGTNVASDRVTGFDIDRVTINGGYRTGLDLNGVDGATIDHVLVANVVHGNGIALTDSADVTITNTTTKNNAWGGLALYQTNAYYDQQLNNISVDGTNKFHEANGVYEEDQSASLDMGSLSLAGYTYADVDNSVLNDQYMFFQKNKQSAFDFATDAALNSGHLSLANTFVEGWNGTAVNDQFYVGAGTNGSDLSINAATSAAAAGNTINVDSGTYAEDVSAARQLTFEFGNSVTVNSFTLTSGGAGSVLDGDLTATGAVALNGAATVDGDVTAGSFTSNGALTLGGDLTAGSIALNGGVTLTTDATFDTSSANGAIVVASVTGGGNDLTIDAGTGNTSLGNVSGVGALDVDGTSTLTGTSYAANTATFGGAVTLASDATITTTGDLAVASVTGAGKNLTLASVGKTSLGNVSGVGALVVSGKATLTGNSYTAASESFGRKVSLTGDTTLDASGVVSVASVSGHGHDLTIDGSSATLGNVSNAGALVVDAAATLTGKTYVADSMNLGAVTLTGDTTLDTSGDNGEIVVASIDGSTAGGQSLDVNAGAGNVSLGNLGAATRLGAVSDASNTTLAGSTYNADSFVFGGDVTLTAATTTLNTTQSSSAAGDITFNGDIFGTADGAQSLTLVAGSGTGAATANGDISLQNAGTSDLRLGDMTVSGNNFSALTVWLADDYNSTLTGNQVFAADTLHAGGDVNSTVGGDASGHIVADGDVAIVAEGDVSGTIGGQNVNLKGNDVNSQVTAANNASITGNTVEGSYAGDNVALTANNVNANVDATNLALVANNGSVDGNWTNIQAIGTGVVYVNGQPEINVNPAQLVVEGFTLPAGSTIGANGQLILPQGVLLGLLSPGGGKPKMIMVHSVQQLGQLLSSGYTVIVIDLSNRDGDKPVQLASN